MMSNGGNPYLISTLSEAQIKELVDANALPDVTAADAGKVLTVSESGSWTAAEGGGGASGLVVHGIAENDTQYLDKTYAEIMGSIENGIMPVFVLETPIQNEYLVMVASVEGENMYGVVLLRYSSSEVFTPLMFVATSADGVLTLT